MPKYIRKFLDEEGSFVVIRIDDDNSVKDVTNNPLELRDFQLEGGVVEEIDFKNPIDIGAEHVE